MDVSFSNNTVAFSQVDPELGGQNTTPNLLGRMKGRVVSFVNDHPCITTGLAVTAAVAIVGGTIYGLTSGAEEWSGSDPGRVDVTCSGAEDPCKKLGFLLKQGATYIADGLSHSAECVFWRNNTMKTCSISAHHGDSNLAFRKDYSSHLMAGTECHNFNFPDYKGSYVLTPNPTDLCSSILSKI